MFSLCLSLLTIAIWLFLFLARGQFWRVSRNVAPFTNGSQTEYEPCHVVAVVPARNEADVLSEALLSLEQQKFAGRLSIVVVNDNSTDATAIIARKRGVRVVEGLPLPAGWTGKLWALEQGVSFAIGEWNPDFVLLTDADIHHDPENLATLLRVAEEKRLDLASHMVKLHCQSWAECFTIPAFVFFFFLLYPPRFVSSSNSRIAGAAGGCVLIRPAMIKKIGGFASIRNQVIDDCSLAAAVKRNGGRLWLGLTPGTFSIRPYAGLNEIGRMISRSAFSQLHHSVFLLIFSVLGLLFTFLAPVILALRGSIWALGAYLMMSACYWPMVRFYRLNPLWSLILPLSACFYVMATFHSAWTYWRGKGGQWKDRFQDHTT